MSCDGTHNQRRNSRFCDLSGTPGSCADPADRLAVAGLDAGLVSQVDFGQRLVRDP